jgi:hypothetical protein
MSHDRPSKDHMMAKRYISNFSRAGILAIPGFGAAIEKALFGLLDDKEKEEAHLQITDALNELSLDVRFAQADLKDGLAMLAEKISLDNKELAEKIEKLEPIHIENFIVQDIRPLVINFFFKITPDEIRLLSNIAGMLPNEIPTEETPEKMGAVLFDAAANQDRLSEFMQKIIEDHPSSLDQISIRPSPQTIKDSKLKFITASQSLLKWPTTLGNKIWLHRAELDRLQERLNSTTGTADLILGKPGTGKSAILALLSQRLTKDDIAVLAIKSDMLPRSVKDLNDLQSYLHLPFSVIKCLSILSRSEPVVLIIDQLDAISEFVDQKSERLNILLDIIQAASMLDRVHIISSCRWFEYQHDIRLTTIEAEQINLNPPIWEDVKKVLKDAGFPEEHWSDEARDLLGVPLHLKILLDLKFHDPSAKVPSSLQGLLEGIWQQRIISGDLRAEKLNFLDILCKRMSEEEELWVPRTLADDYVHVFEELQEGNILQLDSSGLKVGFVHQTYFDFSRARSFASGQERLSEYVIQRQDGLFIRPVLLSTLHYLREASPITYNKEVRSLWENVNLRSHLRNLLIEYMGGIDNPNDIEISCLLKMLEDEKLRLKVALTMAGSPGWFSIIKDRYLPDIMNQGPELAHLSIPILSRAFSFSKDEVLRLVKDIWLSNGKYDENILTLFMYLSGWNEQSVNIICEVANRHESRWISHVADLVSQAMPDLAPKIVKADFDRRLQEAIKKEAETILPPPPQEDANEEEKMIYHLSNRKGETIGKILQHGTEWYELPKISEAAPKAFIEAIWPWFNSVLERIAYEPHPYVTGYQEDHSLDTVVDRELVTPAQPITALRNAIVNLSEKEPDSFLFFLHKNIESPYMAIHRLLSEGLIKLVTSHPEVILDYLISDPRRLVIGDFHDCHKSSRQLITAVVPYLNNEGRKKLENSIVNWNRYYKEKPDWSPKERFDRRKWNREHRLRLLRSFPENHLSEEVRRLRDQEERALPNVQDWDSRVGGGGFVGSPMSHDQMAKAKDEDILCLFEELDDSTEWDHPKRKWDFIGGSIQASREFAKLADQNPERVAKLIPNFKPGKQERPAAMAIETLAKSSFPSDRLFKLIEDLVEKGHSSFEFRRDVARALENRAKSNKGLPDNIIKMLENWLSEDPYPSIEEIKIDNGKEERNGSILWGYGFSFSLPGGRETYLEAIADGYLLRDQPEYKSFSKIIEARLDLEKHPAIWKVTLHNVSLLFNWDRRKASSYFDKVIKNFRDVRESKQGVLEIGRILHLVPDQDTILSWLTLFRESANEFGKQAFGELVMLRCLQKPEDEWARHEVKRALDKKELTSIHRGLAFAAAYNWDFLPQQEFCTEVIIKLSDTADKVVQEAISQVFLYGERVTLNDRMKGIIEAILSNDQILLKSADKLVEGVMDQTATDPEIIANICNRVLEAGKAEIQNIGSHLASIAEPIVSIALTLHRKMPPYRAIGLELFEKLIESNIPYARQALDLLDRKPITSHEPKPLRRRRLRKV